MSQGHCHCPCMEWGHDGALCTGTADTSMAKRPSQVGVLEVPVCATCRHAVHQADDRGVILPPGSANR